MTKILVVEDEKVVAWDLKEALELLGYIVIDSVVSGAQAIASAIQNQPDLVLMDIQLADEIDGITAADQIYYQLNIPVVYLTAHADPATLRRAIDTSSFGYLVKPFKELELNTTIQIALHRHQQSESYLSQFPSRSS